MAKDDYFVIMYRILVYLYACDKEGSEFNPKAISFERMGIPESYWTNVIEDMLDHKYLKGATIEEFCGGAKLVEWDRPRITQEGVEFISENSNMAKAKKVLKELKETIPGLSLFI